MPNCLAHGMKCERRICNKRLNMIHHFWRIEIQKMKKENILMKKSQEQHKHKHDVLVSIWYSNIAYKFIPNTIFAIFEKSDIIQINIRMRKKVIE